MINDMGHVKKVPVILVRFFYFLNRFSKYTQLPNLMKILNCIHQLMHYYIQ